MVFMRNIEGLRERLRALPARLVAMLILVLGPVLLELIGGYL